MRLCLQQFYFDMDRTIFAEAMVTLQALYNRSTTMTTSIITTPLRHGHLRLRTIVEQLKGLLSGARLGWTLRQTKIELADLDAHLLQDIGAQDLHHDYPGSRTRPRYTICYSQQQIVISTHNWL